MMNILLTGALFWLPAYLYRQHALFDQPLPRMRAGFFCAGIWLISFIASLVVWGKPNAGTVIAALCAYRTLTKPAPEVV